MKNAMENIKARAIARLKASEPLGLIAEELSISISLVEEWKNEFDIRDNIDIEHDALVASKAVDILRKGEVTPDELQASLMATAHKLSRNMAANKTDIEYAQINLLSAKAVAELQRAFFNDSKAPSSGGYGSLLGSLKD